MKENTIFKNDNGNNYEMRCPKCCFYIGIDFSRKQNNYNIKINCENCGKSEMSVEEFDLAMRNNMTKTCNCCCKSFEANRMFISSNYEFFFCIECFEKLKSQNSINELDYIYVKDLGKYCKKHNNEKNKYFCLNCNKHICEDCQKEHVNHKIKNIIDAVKNNNEIEKLKQICKDEDQNIIKEQNFYYEILNNMKQRFEKIKKNNEDILSLKKILFDIYESNRHNYTVYKYTNIITSDKNYGISTDELNKIENIINSISLTNNNDKSDNNNNNMNNNKKTNNSEQNKLYGRQYSKSVIKENKKTHINSNINLGINKTICNQNKNNKNKNNKKNYNTNKKEKWKIYGGSVSTFKSNKNKTKTFMITNEMFTKEFSRINFNLYNGNNTDNFQILKKLSNSIINMLYLGDNKILICVFSQKNDLILGEIQKEKNVDNNNSISLEIVPVSKKLDKPINYMELCDDGSILSCSDDQLIKFRLINKSIHILFTDIITDKYKPIISCISISKEIIIALSNQNIIHLYENGKDNLFKIDGYKIISMNKLSEGYIILVAQKEQNKNKNKIVLIVLKINQNKIISIFIKDLNVNEKEKEKIIIKKVFENLASVSYPGKGFFIYDYLKNNILYNISCDIIISMKIEILNENNAYCYTVETKDNEGKNIEEMKLKRYIIKKQDIQKENKIEVLENKNINLTHRKQINDMIIINDNNGVSVSGNKRLVLLGDNDGNILYLYC